MYKVMVVDDESWGRKSISKMISELSLDVEVIAEARHGEEALELIEIGRPHIVVTDMNMPVMNGQQFLRALRDRYGHIFTIVISGYSQFEYLQSAIQYQACDYLLKPVALAELRASMIRAMEASRKYMSFQEQKESREVRLLKQSVFLQNVTGQRIANKSDIAKQAEDMHIAGLTNYRLAVMRFRRFGETARTRFHGNADLLMFSIENMLHEILRDAPVPVYKSDDRQRICLIAAEGFYHDGQLYRWLADFQTAVQCMLKLDVLAGVSGVMPTLAELPEAYRIASQVIREQKLHGSGLKVAAADQWSGGFGSEVLTLFDTQTLRQAFACGNVRDSRRLLEAYMQKLENSSAVTVGQVHRELAKIRELVLPELSGLPAASAALFEPQIIEGVTAYESVRLLLEKWLEVAEACWENKGQEADASGLIGAAAHFLDLHYFEDVSLIDVATRFHMDPSYLSKLFKTVTGENFIEYLTRKRMEKACELLTDTDQKISAISELVGYENQRYFSQVFKKNTGLTPSEYRESPLHQTQPKN